MPMSTDLPVRAPVAHTRKRINWTWNDILKAHTDSVVAAVPGLIVLVLLLASVALPKAIPMAMTGRALAQNVSEVTVNVFPGGFNWGIYVAQERGLFVNNGVRVTVQGTPGSVAQMTGLSEGKFDIAMTAVDNIVAYVEGQGEAPIGPQSEFFAFHG